MSSSATRASIEVVMPQMGVSVAEGTVTEWRVDVGNEVVADQTICEVTTDKIDVEIPAPGAGTLTRVLVDVGETVAVGTPLAEIDAGAAEPGGGSSEEAAGSGHEDGPAADARGSEIDRSTFVSPVVRRIADEHGIDLDSVEGHGVGGRVRKADLLAVLGNGGGAHGHGTGERTLHTESPYRPEPEEAQPADGGAERAPAPAGGPTAGEELVGPTRREPMAPMRQAIARHMLASRQASAHCTTIVEADFSAVATRRRERAGRGRTPTYLAFVARAVVSALGRHPILNASIEGSEIVHHDDVNLGIAVALDEGLIVPVIRRAQRLSVAGLAEEIAALASRARAGELGPDDTYGGTFTITNPGQFGALLATPIINQPQVGILDLEAVVDRPVAIDDGAGGKAVAIRPMSYLCMSWDHRALDGVEAARFLGDVRAGVEGGGE